MNKQKFHIWLPLLLSVAMSVGIFIGFKMRDHFPENSFFYHEKKNAVQEVLSLIKNKSTPFPTNSNSTLPKRIFLVTYLRKSTSTHDQ